MASVALSGNDVLIINGRVFSDFADGDFFKLDFPNEIAKAKTGKNNNTIFAQDFTGNNGEGSLRLIRGSADDSYMNGLLSGQNSNFAGTVLMAGQFVKSIGDGQGDITPDTYNMAGGIFQKQVGVMGNAEGSTEQAVAVYPCRFAQVARAGF